MFCTRKLLSAMFVTSLLVGGLSSTADACHGRDCCCDAQPVCCDVKPVCCKPAPPPMCTQTLCLKDPCSCCTKLVNVCIPACCCDEQPCITCRPGIFGRKIYTATWKCCGHSVEIVWTKHGKVRVRG